MKPKYISFSAKCSDLFGASLHDAEGNSVGQDYDGYVPKWFPEQHYGDYVILDVDLETGTILNWRKPTEAEVSKTFQLDK